MVTHGGLGFHLTEIYARFGQDTAVFFFKVRAIFTGHLFYPPCILSNPQGHLFVLVSVKRHNLFQQDISATDVRCHNTDTFNDKMGQSYRWPNPPLEHVQRHCWTAYLPTALQELELCNAGNLR
jgi:hypothetical protein